MLAVSTEVTPCWNHRGGMSEEQTYCLDGLLLFLNRLCMKIFHILVWQE